MTGNKPCKRILNSSYEVHTALGPGLMESEHEVILHLALPTSLLYVEQQKGIAVFWESRLTDMGFRADRIVESKVFIEIKSVDRLAQVHSKQGVTYLKISGIKPGLLVHINEQLIIKNVRRRVNNRKRNGVVCNLRATVFARQTTKK